MNPADLEILRTGFAFIPEEMGVALKRSAYSPNIKERMDASCALFDEAGRMVSQAEHIPVHLGSMPAAVDAVLRDFPGTLREGDQVILNDPYRGGTHLPDVTLVRPVFVRTELVGFTANRAHHADIGGIAPGSMPADAVDLEEEGIVLEPQKFLDRGEERRSILDRFREETLNPVERLGDLRAQVAANELGARRLAEFADKWGVTRLRSHIGELLDYAERRMRSAIQTLPRGTWAAEDYLESAGSRDSQKIRIRAEVTIGGSGLTVDFQGTDRQVRGNVNAPFAVTLSATYYVVLCVWVLDAPLPLAVPPRVGDVRRAPRSGRTGPLPGRRAARRPVRSLRRARTAAILSEQRSLQPRGLKGGEHGRPGRNRLVRQGRRKTLPA